MAVTRNAIITDLGLADITKAQSTNEGLKWNTVCVGDGNGEVPTFESNAISLVNETWSGEVTNKTISENDETIVSIHCVIPSSVGDFWIREAGLKNENGELVVVAQTHEIEKITYGDSGVITEIDLYFDIKVNNSDVFDITVNESAAYMTLYEMKKIVSALNSTDEKLTQDIADIAESYVQKEEGKSLISDEELLTIQSDISELKTNKADTTVTDSMSNDIDSIHIEIEEIDSRLDGIDTDIEDINSGIEEINSSIGEINSGIEEIGTQIEELGTKDQSLEESINGLTLRVEALETEIQTLKETQ